MRPFFAIQQNVSGMPKESPKYFDHTVSYFYLDVAKAAIFDIRTLNPVPRARIDQFLACRSDIERLS